MSSKKYRKKLKHQYTKHQPKKMFLKDREQVLNYLKTRPYEIVTSREIIQNTSLEYNTTSSVSRTIKAINYYTNEHIETIQSKGFMYYG